MEKLKNDAINNYENWPKIFGISADETLEIIEAMNQYNGGDKSQSYKDWCEMYFGIHREYPHESQLRGWLACYRWMKSKQTNGNNE